MTGRPKDEGRNPKTYTMNVDQATVEKIDEVTGNRSKLIERLLKDYLERVSSDED